MKDDCKYEKADQKIIRNEFLHNGLCCGKYDFPIIRKQAIDVDEISLISYCDIKKGEKGNAGKTVHFFTYDWKFEKVYENAEEELQKLSEFYCVLSPDFSLFTNMPRALQIESVFKNRWCGAFWQSKGLRVIPTVSWSDEKSFDYCFVGVVQLFGKFQLGHPRALAKGGDIPRDNRFYVFHANLTSHRQENSFQLTV